MGVATLKCKRMQLTKTEKTQIEFAMNSLDVIFWVKCSPREVWNQENDDTWRVPHRSLQGMDPRKVGLLEPTELHGFLVHQWHVGTGHPFWTCIFSTDGKWPMNIHMYKYIYINISIYTYIYICISTPNLHNLPLRMWKGWIAPFFPWPNLCFFSTCCDRLYRTRLPRGYKGFLTAVSWGARLTTKHVLCGICEGEWCGWCGRLGKLYHPPWMPVEFVKVENWPQSIKISTGWDGGPQLMRFLLWDIRR